MATWGQRLEEVAKPGVETDVEAVIGDDYRKAKDAERAGVAGVASVLQHLTRARHMCYRRMFLLETCLRWNGGAPLKPETCRESRMLFSACNSELLRKVKAECPKQFETLVSCLDANDQDASKCASAMLPFDRCTEDFMPGEPGTFF